MNKKRIAVIGKGTAGAMSMAHIVKQFPNDEITWYFDPNRPAQSVGEGSTLNLPADLNKNLAFFWPDLKKINGNYKIGIFKENWGKQYDFFHHFGPPTSAIHFSAVDLQKYVYDQMKDKVNIVEEDVSINDLDADFILNASGTPKNFDDFYKSDYIPVNSAHVVQCAWEYPKFDYTMAIAGKHGWVFVIPLQNRCSIGYLYNNNISKIEDLQEDLNIICTKYNLKPSTDANNLNFNHYYRKVNYEDSGRIVHNGNASFFLEPLEAMSFAITGEVYHNTSKVWKGEKSFEQANEDYLLKMQRVEFMIMLHYAAGSKFDTPFWEYAQERGISRMKASANDPELKRMYEVVKNRIDNNIFPTIEQEFDYGGWLSNSYECHIRNLSLRPLFDQILA